VLSKAGQVKKEEKASIAVELALRASRSTLTRSDAKGARETLQNAYLHADLWGKNARPAKGTLEELRSLALEEVEQGKPGRAARAIAGQGAYWLAVRRVLREARFFADKERRDGRSASRVLDQLMRSRWGIEVLHRAILDGREGHALARVDEEGRRVPGIAGEPMEMSNEWLRTSVVPLKSRGESEQPEQGDPGPDVTTRVLLERRQAVEKAVRRLEEAHEDLRRVQDADGAVLVDTEGVQTHVMEDLSQRLDAVRRKLDRYGTIWEAKNVAAPTLAHDEDGEGDEG
jgi:hypothetical protein